MENKISVSNEKYLRAIGEQRLLFERTYAANRALEQKATTVVLTSGFISGLVSAAKVSTTSMNSAASLIILAGILALFLVMLLAAMRVWIPGPKVAPHTADWDNAFERYLYASDEVELQTTLNNYIEATKVNLRQNNGHAKLITLASYCLAGQVIALVILLFVS